MLPRTVTPLLLCLAAAAPACAAASGRALPPLAGLPWFAQGERVIQLAGQPDRGALAFPVGTTYKQALQIILDGVVREGRLPARARLVPGLPPGVTVSLPGPGQPRLRVSLNAPWGYSSEGWIRPPLFQWAAGIAGGPLAAAHRAISRGQVPLPRPVRLQVQAVPLPACAVRVGDTPRSVCRRLRPGAPSVPIG